MEVRKVPAHQVDRLFDPLRRNIAVRDAGDPRHLEDVVGAVVNEAPVDEAIGLMRRHLPDLHRARLRVIEG